MVSQWFIINGLKNICGKPRPDLLARCQPDIQNVARYVVGGISNITSNGQLVSAAICTNSDTAMLNDGFRSYPSGHSSSSAAGLGHLALFLAFKFGVVFPFAIPPVSTGVAALSALAFPSRTSVLASQEDPYELHDMSHPGLLHNDGLPPRSSQLAQKTKHQLRIPSARHAGAAPPLFLLVVVVAPLFGSFFIAASRWFNFRHHGFDILFGYFIGTITTLISFRMYHLPLTYGAGWAWGPRSPDKSFWAGIGSSSWAEPWEPWALSDHDDENTCVSPISHSTAAPEMPLSQLASSRRMAVQEMVNGNSEEAV